MKYTIDEGVARNLSTPNGDTLTLPELFVGLILKAGQDPIEVVEQMLEKNYLIHSSDGTLMIHQAYSELIDNILLDSKKEMPKVDELMPFVLQLQSIYPKGMKADSNGVKKYSLRGNKTDIARHLQKLFFNYGRYSEEDILKATKIYVDKHKDDPYLMTLKYFIWHRDRGSELATYIEALQDDTDMEDSPSIMEDNIWTL